jgi:hypothetical protein
MQGARGTAASLRRALRESFEPNHAFVRAIPRSAEARARVSQNLREALQRPMATSELNRGLVPSQGEMQRGGLVDNCSASHEVGRLETRFHVDHQEDGQAKAYRLLLSSGDEAFDAYAQNVLEKAQAQHLKAHPEEPAPLFSEWALAQIVYDWASTPGCFGGTRPPGKPVYPDASSPWSMTYTSEVQLLAVRYQRP